MLMLRYGYPMLLLFLQLTFNLQRGNPLEVSLTMVPQSHPLLAPRNLEAEASGLLDRMLGVFQENLRCVFLSALAVVY